ncbi:hypothetical protein GCS57_003610 [Vibrio cholerae]
MRLRALTIIATFLSGVVSASSLENVTIEQLGYDKNYPDRVFIKTSVAPTSQSRVQCHNDNNWNYVMPLLSPFEGKMYSALLAAHSAKQKVTLIGTNKCDAFDTIEGLHVIYTY